MPFEKGHKRLGGREKGTPNKKTRELEQMAEELGIIPFKQLLLFAKGDWKALGYDSAVVVRVGKNGETYEQERITPEMRFKATSESCAYLYPKRKAIEHSGEVSNLSPERPLQELSDEELDNL